MRIKSPPPVTEEAKNTVSDNITNEDDDNENEDGDETFSPTSCDEENDSDDEYTVPEPRKKKEQVSFTFLYYFNNSFKGSERYFYFYNSRVCCEANNWNESK